MLRWLLVAALAAFVLAANDTDNDELQSEKPHDRKLSKEINYKKYIGEQNYKVPFMTRVGSQFANGQTIHAIGKLKKKPIRVDFNFQKGASKEADLPLHFSIRFDEGIIHSKFVYNTFENGNWSEKEQRINNPFKADKEFDMRIRLLDNKFHVYANRKDVGKFEMRQQLEGIDHVAIRGDLAALSLFHYGGQLFPNPYSAIVSLSPGKRLDISGIPTGKRFNVNLYRENKDYALQVSFRFNEGAIVRNAMEGGTWGKEEREGKMVISKGEVFDLTLINEKFSIQIFLNGQRFTTFAHRGSPDGIKTLEVDGDVDLHTVTVNDALGQ